MVFVGEMATGLSSLCPRSPHGMIDSAQDEDNHRSWRRQAGALILGISRFFPRLHHNPVTASVLSSPA